MSNASPEDSVREFVVSALKEMNYDTEDLTGDTVLGPAGMDLDSLGIAEIAVRVEDTYGARFFEDEMERVGIMTIDEFVAEIAGRVQPSKVAGESG
jgi:acyl carrier protein